MHTAVITGTKEATEVVHAIPCVSVILSFDPAMRLKKELTTMLTEAADKVEADLHKNYPEDICLLVMEKLNSVIKELNFYTNKKSIAIFVSPAFSKIIYLDMLVHVSIKVATSFRVREVVNCKKQLQQYLLLQTTTEGFKIFVGSKDNLIKIVSSPYINRNFANSKTGNACVPAIEEAIRHVDQTLEIILQTYKMPLFVAAADYMAEQLTRQSKFSQSFIDFIPLTDNDISPYKLQQLAAAFTSDWQAVMQRKIRNSILNAALENKLSTGIKNVWREAMNHKSSLLIIDEDFECSYAGETSEEAIFKAIRPYSNFSCISNLTDEIIEKMLEDGGDVAFAAANSLQEFDHIVLIKK